MNQQRAEEIGGNLKAIVINLNAIKEEELKEILASASREQALGPMINPSAFQSGIRFNQIHLTQKVIRALLDFKRAVKGIGDFR